MDCALAQHLKQPPPLKRGIEALLSKLALEVEPPPAMVGWMMTDRQPQKHMESACDAELAAHIPRRRRRNP